MQVLWLTSWYPNPYEPNNGDFIKRQAEAVSEIVLVDVIHVVQAGINLHTKAGAIHEREGNFREIIQSFPFKKWGIDFIDKIRYNIKYHIFIRKLINSYVGEFGEPQLIHVHIPVKAGLHAMYYADLWRVKYMVTEHSSHYTEKSHDSFFNRSSFYRRNVSKVMKGASTVISVSDAVGNTLKQLFPIKHYKTIRNTVDTTLFNYKPVHNAVFRWIHVSSMHEHQKNIDGIIKAFTELNKQRTDWELIMVGPYKEEQKQKVTAAKLTDKIIFLGEVEYKEVAVQMQQANAFILFSRHENFPCVIEEALCCGLPVIASNAGGITEAINETNGLLVDIDNTTALTSAIIQLMNTYTKYNRENIAKEAIALYNKETIANQIVDLYKTVLVD